MSRVITQEARERVRQDFEKRGQTLRSWALEHGYKPSDVHRVLNGLSRAAFGRGHEIAVKLGLKEPE